MGRKGEVKTGGRKKGSLNKRTLELNEILSKYDANPAEILALIMLGDESRLKMMKRISIDSEGNIIELPPITPEMQLTAAKELIKYAYPQKKAIDHTTAGESLGNSLTDVLKSIIDARKK